MKLTADARFLGERARFSLRLHCEDCALFDVERAKCAHGYPTAEHRQPTEGLESSVVFCKDFEMA